MATKAPLVSDLPVPPGEFLAETLEALGLSQAEAARRMGRPVQALNEIVKAKKEITPETALQLERVLRVPAHVWLGLESAYRQALARRADTRRLAKEVSLVAVFPYAAMVKLGWISGARDGIGRVVSLLQFFGVSSLSRAPAMAAQAAYRVGAPRRSQARPSEHALGAWLRRGELEAMRIETRLFDEERLGKTLPELRRLTTETSDDWAQLLQERLATCGVALVLVPHLPATRAHGAARWLSSRKALVQMSIRGRWADIFWFSLFHELGHVLLHGRKETFIEWADGARSRQEAEADAFARDVLIPSEVFDCFVRQNPRPSAGSVETFARQVGIDPGIVVGRLHHDGRLPHSHLNHLRRQLTLVGER